MPKIVNITGEVFGNLTVLSRHCENNSSNKVQWLCQCKCGNTTVVTGNALKNGNTKSCGCLSSPDLKGKIFGKLRVIEKLPPSDKDTHISWKCLCECGNYSNVSGTKLVNGITRSCGCLRRIANITHGMRNTPEYGIWLGIKNRCYNEKTDRYKDYGGRGITVCDEWKDDFITFYNDMGPRPTAEHSIDRKDNNKGYSKENCRWATGIEQANNTSSNAYYEYDGKMQSLATWCRELQLDYNRVRQRIHNGMLFEVAIQIDKIVKDSKLTLNGVTKSIQSWCKDNGVKFTTFRYRINSGWTFEEALTLIEKKLITLDGHSEFLEDWCELLALDDKESIYLKILRGEAIDSIIDEINGGFY